MIKMFEGSVAKKKKKIGGCFVFTYVPKRELRKGGNTVVMMDVV